jgi:hypothetical protein
MELQAFINKNFKNIRIDPLSRESKDALLPIYKHMTASYKALPKLLIREIYPEEHDQSYIPSDIQPHLKRCVYNSSYNFKVRHRDIRLYIHAPKISKSFNRDCVKHVYMWLSIAGEYASTDCSSEIVIHLYLTEHMKVMPEDNSHIGREHVNTAFTTPCSKKTTICIFRKEEWKKVFIHETFHNLGLDFSSMANSSASKQISEMFRVKTDIRLYEAYCETWAEIIYSQFITFYSIKGHTNYDLMFQKLDDILRAEVIFSIFQCAKVLEYNKMSYTDLYSVSTGGKYREDTQVLAYYVIRSVLIFHKNAFISWCVENNGKHKFLDFDKTDRNIDSFCEFIRGIYTSPTYVESINRVEDWFKYNKQSSAYEFNTLRMTIHG